MNRRTLVFALLALCCAGCTLQPAVSEAVPTATLAPTPESSPTPTTAPSVTPTVMATSLPTATAIPTPTPTPGPWMSFDRLILIDQDVQTMYVYEHGQEIRRIPVSTGKPDQVETMTPAWEGDVGHFVGTFFAFGTWADEAWYLFEHYGSMLIHSAPYLKEDGVKIYQEMDLLGVRPASHGCIRLPPEEATWFSSWGPQGAHVIILPLSSAG